MTTQQQQLIGVLASKGIRAKFNGDFLNCHVDVASGKKNKRQKFAFVFDSPAECDGARLLPASCRGAYSEEYAKIAFREILRAGGGDAEVAKFDAEATN